MKTTIELIPSVLTKQQFKTRHIDYIDEHGDPCVLIALIRYDDQCGNGHNSFSITGEIYENQYQRGEPTVTHENGKKLWLTSCGCVHDEIVKRLPDLAPFIKWHLCGSDGPMHYVANTAYHVEQGKLDYARSSAVWPDATDEELVTLQKEGRLSTILMARLPALMAEFKAAVESLGFTY